MTRTVIYQRGSMSVEVPATVGRTEFETVDEHGLVVRTESRDFLVLADHLVLDGERALPKPGDRISEPSGNLEFVYEVMAPAGEPVYRYSDPYRKALRIHTKLIETNTP
jgi:hypothetical protein